MFTSELKSKEYLIDDSTPNMHEALQFSRFKGMKPRDFSKVGYCGFKGAKSLPFTIPEVEWKERAEELEKTKTRLSDLIVQSGIPSKNQKNTNFCWMYAPVGIIEVNRVVMGAEYISLSPASAASRFTNFRNIGGWGTEAVEFLGDNGVSSEKLWPNAQINRKYNTEESKQDALKYQIKDWYDLKPRNLNELFTCLLLRIPVAVGLNWWGHEVYFCDLVILSNGGYGIRFRNSWGGEYGDNGFSILTGSKMLPDDAIAPCTGEAS